MTEEHHKKAGLEIKSISPTSILLDFQRKENYETDFECELNFLSNFVEFIPDIIAQNKYLSALIALSPCTPEYVLEKLLVRNNSLVLDRLMSKDIIDIFVDSHLD